MQKFRTTILAFTIISIFLNLTLSTFAINVNDLLPQGGKATTTTVPTDTGTSDTSKTGSGITGAISGSAEMQAIQGLPSLTADNIIASAIKIVLRSAIFLTLFAIIAAAIYYLISRGNEEEVNKAKEIILYLIIGMAIMAGSYGIVIGISKFKFLE